VTVVKGSHSGASGASPSIERLHSGHVQRLGEAAARGESGLRRALRRPAPVTSQKPPPTTVVRRGSPGRTWQRQPAPGGVRWLPVKGSACPRLQARPLLPAGESRRAATSKPARANFSAAGMAWTRGRRTPSAEAKTGEDSVLPFSTRCRGRELQTLAWRPLTWAAEMNHRVDAGYDSGDNEGPSFRANKPTVSEQAEP
jgi:hypothetical protein